MGSVLIVEKSPCSLSLAAACGKTPFETLEQRGLAVLLGDETPRFPSADSLRSCAPDAVGIAPKVHLVRYAFGEDIPER